MFEHLVRKNILELIPYSSARSEFKGVAEVLMDANENPFDHSFNRYPDPMQKELKAAIGRYRGIDPKHIFLSNGSDGIIEMIVRTFCEPGKDSISYFTPGFSMYKVAAKLNAAEVNVFELDENFGLDEVAFVKNLKENDKLAFITSPNNPTGNSYSIEQVKYIAANFKGLVVLDEAYVDFSSVPSGISLLDEYPNLIVMQTFSKAFGAAGIRLGMVFMHEELVGYLNKVKMPYNIGNNTQQEALKVLSDTARIKEEVSQLITERKRLEVALADHDQIVKVYPSDTNFLLTKFVDSQKVYKFFLAKSIILRDMSRVKGCENCLRITVGTPEENDRLLRTLKELA